MVIQPNISGMSMFIMPCCARCFSSAAGSAIVLLRTKGVAATRRGRIGGSGRRGGGRICAGVVGLRLRFAGALGDAAAGGDEDVVAVLDEVGVEGSADLLLPARCLGRRVDAEQPAPLRRNDEEAAG